MAQNQAGEQGDALRIVIADRYELRYKIGAGGFGSVFAAHDRETGNEVAIKLARIMPLRQDGLDREFEIGRLLPEGDNRFGFPRMIEYGTYQGHHFLVTELLGPSVENLLQYCEGGLSVKTIVMIARKTILCLEQMHTRGLIHRDIKPHNIVLSDKGNKVFLIDFGLSQALDPSPQQQQQFAGTPIFSAPTALNNEPAGFKDDLLSLVIVCSNLFHGGQFDQLIMDEAPAPSTDVTPIHDPVIFRQKVRDAMMNLSSHEICNGLPEEFAELYDFVNGPDRRALPDYDQLNHWFDELWEEENWGSDDVFDWTERLFWEESRNLDLRTPDFAE